MAGYEVEEVVARGSVGEGLPAGQDHEPGVPAPLEVGDDPVEN